MRVSYTLVLMILVTLKAFTQQRDTVRCVILYSDTASSTVYLSPISLVESDLVLMATVYDVREKCANEIKNIYPFENVSFPEFWKHIVFLDRNLEPLPPNIVVWQAKQIQ